MKCFFLILSLLPFFSRGQDLTGTWVGHSDMALVKMVVIHIGDSIIGYTYDEGPGWCQATFAGVYNNKIKYLKGKGLKMLHQSGDHGLAVYNLDYFKSEGRESLNGTVGPKGSLLQLLTLGASSQIFLHRETNDIDTLEFMRPFLARKNKASSEIVKSGTPSKKTIDTARNIMPEPNQSIPSIENEKEARISKLVQNIYTNEDSIKIALYDNGEVDQDSVTLFFDNAIILNRYMISDKPMELTIALPKDGKEHSLDLFAHNLGTIPPNTALLIITAGKKRYELRASYDLSTNARITFAHTP